MKIEARQIQKNSFSKSYGIKYSLTLHAQNGERILGYDNAHGIPGSKNYVHDHIHKSDRIVPYEYESAEKLLSDFWNDVFIVLKRIMH